MAEGSNAVRAQSGLPTSSGCQVQPGTYQARWDKGHFKVLLHNTKGKEKEVTFAIFASTRTAASFAPVPSSASETPTTPSTERRLPASKSLPSSPFTHNRFTDNGKTFSQEGTNVIADCMSNPEEDAITAMLCTGYIEGIADLLSETAICISPEVSGKELKEVVMQYASKHQDILHHSASVLISAALRESFPCAK
ncbi:MAG TPA: Rap1a/Tai family immunity protein [Candidatus Angelobacter sp.]|nr:Rap1a/Tai family immunity protein [Candidatus Angelobacter sp.]